MPRSDAQPTVEGDPAVPAAARDRAPLAPALEPNLYLEPEVVRLEQEAIFERTWQLAGHVSDLREPGSYLTADVVDQPVLVVRDHDGEIRAFRNVCRHRGSRLLRGRGSGAHDGETRAFPTVCHHGAPRLLSGGGSCGKAIRCLYHGWTYRPDGTLIGVP